MRIRGIAYFVMIGYFFLCNFFVTAQDQRVADSLSIVLQNNELDGVVKLELLYNLSYNEISDFDLKLEYAESLIALSEQNNNQEYLSYGYFQKGNAKQFIGNLEDAITAYFECAEVAKSADLIPVEGSAYGAIADIYDISDNHENAMLYYRRAISTLRNTSDTLALASFILNAGDALLTNKNYDSALVYFNESGELFRQLNYSVGNAFNLGNIGMVYASTGQHDLAEKNINEAISILEESGSYRPICDYLIYMANIYLDRDDLNSALSYASRSLELAESYGLKEQISNANLKLSELNQVNGDLAASYRYFKDHIIYRDSVKNIEAVQQMADQRTEFEVSQKQVEVDLLNEQKRTQRIIAIATAIALALIVVLAIGLYRRNTFIKKTNGIIAAEKDRSENLLLNILPEETAQELKEHGKVKAQKFESVSVLFTDFKGFTKFSEKLDPEELVERVDFYFSKFDAIMEKHGLEKIKTIGDAYMSAAGLPFPIEDHAARMTRAAIDIVRFVQESKDDPDNDQAHFDIRVGIHSGPVVAGVVGTKKFSYDIWGDTVNVASRMESNSEPGKINVSENTYQLIKEEFDCSFRGEIEAKNRGSLKMYFVEEGKVNG
ncbi:MAG: adenylate/guanylate cyclase domain-containing protein [Flavobacteriaceae bacterium]